MAQTEMTAEEVFESLNGFEEIAVEKAFRADPTSLAQSGQHIRFIRSLVFIVLKREKQMNDLIAKQTVMGMPIAELLEFFTDDEEESKPAVDSSSDEPLDLTKSDETSESDDSGEAVEPAEN